MLDADGGVGARDFVVPGFVPAARLHPLVPSVLALAMIYTGASSGQVKPTMWTIKPVSIYVRSFTSAYVLPAFQSPFPTSTGRFLPMDQVHGSGWACSTSCTGGGAELAKGEMLI